MLPCSSLNCFLNCQIIEINCNNNLIFRIVNSLLRRETLIIWKLMKVKKILSWFNVLNQKKFSIEIKILGNATQLIKSFSSDWKKSLDLINQEIMRTFSNFKNGQSILQASLTQLVQYYYRFQTVLSHNSFKHISAKNELLNMHHLMVEIKKHKPNFWIFIFLSN